jgi:hypothetical protein
MGFTGMAAAQDLNDELARRRKQVRVIFQRYFAAEQAEPGGPPGASPD